jgi:hypothetical protein
METFRSSSLLLCAVLTLACVPSSGSEAASAVEVATIQGSQIEHIMPRRDSVGPQSPRFEWTAADGVESYAISVENEIEIVMFEEQGIKTTSVPWPKELELAPGTYFWRITGFKGERMIADSGRAAFLIRTP